MASGSRNALFSIVRACSAGRWRGFTHANRLLQQQATRSFSLSTEVSASSPSRMAPAFVVGVLAGGGAVGFYLSGSSQQGLPVGPCLDASDPVHPYKRTVYIMRGVPASGKSTVAHTILRRHLIANGITGCFDSIASMSRTFILSTDDFFSRIDEESGAEKTVFDMKQIRRNHERNRVRCEIAMELGISPIIVDNTNTQAWEMRPYVELAKANGYNILIKDVHEAQQLTWDVVKERLSARQASTGKDVPLVAVERMMQRFEKLPSDPEAAASHILQSQPPWLAAPAKKTSDA